MIDEHCFARRVNGVPHWKVGSNVSSTERSFRRFVVRCSHCNAEPVAISDRNGQRALGSDDSERRRALPGDSEQPHYGVDASGASSRGAVVCVRQGAACVHWSNDDLKRYISLVLIHHRHRVSPHLLQSQGCGGARWH